MIIQEKEEVFTVREDVQNESMEFWGCFFSLEWEVRQKIVRQQLLCAEFVMTQGIG